MTNSREAISAKPLGIKLKFFTPLCTYRSSILHKVLERIREFHFFFYKKIFFGFFKILAIKITLDFFFKFVLICEFHLDKFHFLVGIFRRFLWLRHQKPKKHKKLYICFIFWVRTIIFGVEVVLGWTNMCAKFQLYRLISKRAMKF